VSDRRSASPFSSLTSASTLLKKGDRNEASSKPWEDFLVADPSLQKYKESEAIGYGIERCLYELNPELACLSPCLIHASALTPMEALLALEDVAMQPNRPSYPVDRHLAAFLISRWKGMKFSDIREMSKPQREVKNLAVLRILAGVQGHFKIKELPNLCQWMAELCAPIITHYHNLKARANVQEEIAKAVSTGQLTKLARVLENRHAIKEDSNDFQEAKIEVLLIESEIKEIESKILNRNQSGFKEAVGILAKLYAIYFGIKNAEAARKGKIRIARLYLRSEKLRETWGDGLMPRSNKSSTDFWRKLWAKMNVKSPPKIEPKIHVDGWLKYD
jgi:hypothetical protein